QLEGGIRHDALCDDLSFARRVENVRRERGDLRRRRRRGPADQIIERLQAVRDEEALQQGGRLLEAVVRPRGGRQGPAPQPVAAALVAQLPTVAAGAGPPARASTRPPASPTTTAVCEPPQSMPSRTDGRIGGWADSSFT